MSVEIGGGETGPGSTNYVVVSLEKTHSIREFTLSACSATWRISGLIPGLLVGLSRGLVFGLVFGLVL